MRVVRPKWAPRTEEQRAAIDAAVVAAQRSDAAEQLMWDAVQAARELAVPAAYLAAAVGRGRATLYRHTHPATGSPTTDAREPDTDQD